MSAKKSTTKPVRKSRGELRKQLAQDLARILQNPECPTMLYNDVAESITTMSSEIDDAFWHSPEQIERSLNAYIASEEKRKGGASR